MLGPRPGDCGEIMERVMGRCVKELRHAYLSLPTIGVRMMRGDFWNRVIVLKSVQDVLAFRVLKALQ